MIEHELYVLLKLWSAITAFVIKKRARMSGKFIFHFHCRWKRVSNKDIKEINQIKVNLHLEMERKVG